MDTVEGLKWGNYIGSPANPPPKVVWQEKYTQVVASLLPLPTGDVIGVGIDTCCLTMHSKQKGILKHVFAITTCINLKIVL